MRALLSVSDKEGIVEFGKELENLGFSGKKLGEQIQKRKNEWLKAYLKGIK